MEPEKSQRPRLKPSVNIPYVRKKKAIVDKYKYLYDLERNNYIDQTKINNIINKNGKINEEDIVRVMNRLYDIVKTLGITRAAFGYACTVFFITMEESNLSTLSIVCLYYACLFFEDSVPRVKQLIDIANIDEQQFRQTSELVFNQLDMIYPSPILFINNQPSTGNESDVNDIIILLTLLASSLPSITIYKPSLIAKTCTYMINGEITIYSKEEMGFVCIEISKYIKKLSKSHLETFQPRAELILERIRYPCNLEVIKNVVPIRPGIKFELGDIVRGKVLGAGTYGEVSKVTRKLCGLDYVIKTTIGNEDNTIASALVEIACLNLLKGQDNIISICGFQYQIGKVDIILEVMDGSLKDYQFERKYLPFFFKQILNAVKVCHDHDLIHRDIKLENLLFDKKNNIIKLADFGLSVPFQSSRKNLKNYLANTISYSPVECLVTDRYPYGKAIDIWATGCVFYALVDLRPLVKHRKTDQEVLDDILAALGTPTPITWPEFAKLKKSSDIIINDYPGIVPQLHKLLSPHSNLILDLLTVNPNTRPTIYEILDRYF